MVKNVNDGYHSVYDTSHAKFRVIPHLSILRELCVSDRLLHRSEEAVYGQRRLMIDM